jgi:hypothetical protein
MIRDDYDSLEQRLQTTLNPVRPDPEFVSHLRYRLATPDDVILETRTRDPLILTAVFSSGLFIGVLILWLLRRIR